MAAAEYAPRALDASDSGADTAFDDVKADAGTEVNAKLVITIYKLIALCSLLGVAVIVLSGICFYLYQRKADLVYIREDVDGRTVAVLNNREMGTTGNVTVSKDRVTDKDKLMAASKFAAAIYGVSPVPEVRARDIAQAITQTVPQRAKKLSDYLEPFLAEQRRDNWSTVWTEQSAYIDQNDKMLVHIIGTQDIDKSPQGVPDKDAKQYNLTIKLYYDKPMEKEQKGNPRAARNLNTGFLILDYGGEEIQKRP